MILDIALGIVLAVVILAFLPLIISVGFFALAVGAFVLVATLGYGALVGGWWGSDFREIAIACVVIGVWAWLAIQIGKRTKIEVGEFLGLSIFGPAVAYLTTVLLFSWDDHAPPRMFGLITALPVLVWLVWRIRRRYKFCGEAK